MGAVTVLVVVMGGWVRGCMVEEEEGVVLVVVDVAREGGSCGIFGDGWASISGQ